VISNKIIEHINTFNYLGCSLSYERAKDVTTKVSKFLQITGIINQVLNPSKLQRQTRLRIYNTLAIPILLYGSEAWTLKEQDKSRITAAEMKLLRKTAKYTWQDHKQNRDITEELKIQPVMEKINNYKNKWIQHVRRMDRARRPHAILKYQTARRRNQGCPLKRLLDGRRRPEQVRRPNSLTAL
jgi:hypothetical protein